VASYIVKRLGIGLVTMFALITITFFLSHIMPGNPFDADNMSQVVVERLMATYKLDRPLGEQYLTYLTNIARGDFGVSYKKSGVTVNELIVRNTSNTLLLGLCAFGVALVVGISLGIWQATTKSQAVRGILLAITTLFVSVPNYVFALMLLLLAGVIHWPVIGLSTPQHYLFPIITMSAYPIATMSRLVKNSFSEALEQEYVILARAKGLKRMKIMLRHVLKNAVLPVVTTAGPSLAFLLTGSFVVENIFTVNGIGKEFTNSIANRDYTVIMGLCIFMGALIILANLLSDIVNALIDPRIRLGK